MTIQGTPGVTVGETKSATYSPTQYVEFLQDADKLGFATDVDVGYETCVTAKNEQGQITGEWSSKVGGQLAWS
jgi:hypothetical protein